MFNTDENQVVSIVVGQPAVWSTHRHSHLLAELMLQKDNHVSVFCNNDPIPFSTGTASGIEMVIHLVKNQGILRAWKACVYKHIGWISNVKSNLPGTYKHDIKHYIDGMDQENVTVEDTLQL